MLIDMSGIGVCSVCGQQVAFGAAFINVGPTDPHDPDKPKSERWVPLDEDIHGWSTFVIIHPVCYARQEGVEKLVGLVDESHRFMRRVAGHADA
jgi:hypothetical protein